MVAGFAEVIEREETLVAEACNHPNLLVLPFSFDLIRRAAQPGTDETVTLSLTPFLESDRKQA
jgi:hypothetical protein